MVDSSSLASERTENARSGWNLPREPQGRPSEDADIKAAITPSTTQDRNCHAAGFRVAMQAAAVCTKKSMSVLQPLLSDEDGVAAECSPHTPTGWLDLRPVIMLDL